MGLVPVIGTLGIAWLNGENLSGAKILSNGELFFIGVALTAAALGELIFDRAPGGKHGRNYGIAVAISIVVISLGAIGYGAAQVAEAGTDAPMASNSSEAAKQRTAKDRRRDASFALLVVSLITGASSIVVSTARS
ncbi:hypothetical protein KZZ52_45380 [Dactylosporangium sp. AC04546]|uniref:hypothetical protein n=1 Tax=Dactylosporangium sp. AC04546 TaxID=2862460 RepID=UPI001EDCEFAD|nr:hypothetical protein [Dactylosporangium sp. AC04546]WVK81149.1 hypothetical protein KZZ52_45380 [Dactylosporangium sp. AC04546]